MFAFINKTRLDTVTSGNLLWDGFHCLFFHSYDAESDLIIKIVSRISVKTQAALSHKDQTPPEALKTFLFAKSEHEKSVHH